jgi:hypothetical protein
VRAPDQTLPVVAVLPSPCLLWGRRIECAMSSDTRPATDFIHSRATGTIALRSVQSVAFGCGTETTKSRSNFLLRSTSVRGALGAAFRRSGGPAVRWSGPLEVAGTSRHGTLRAKSRRQNLVHPTRTVTQWSGVTTHERTDSQPERLYLSIARGSPAPPWGVTPHATKGRIGLTARLVLEAGDMPERIRRREM